MKILIRNDL